MERFSCIFKLYFFQAVKMEFDVNNNVDIRVEKQLINS